MIETHEQYLDAKKSFVELDQDPFASEDAVGDLARAILAYEEQVLGVKPMFRIDSEEALRWYVEKLTDAESKKARIMSQAAAICRDIDRQAEGLRYRFEHEAMSFARTLLSGNRKSVKFLEGTVQFRKTPARVSVEDAQTLLEELPEDLRAAVSEEKVNATALNRLLKVEGGKAYRTDTGEEVAVNGMRVTPEGEAFSVKAGKEA